MTENQTTAQNNNTSTSNLIQTSNLSQNSGGSTSSLRHTDSVIPRENHHSSHHNQYSNLNSQRTTVQTNFVPNNYSSNNSTVVPTRQSTCYVDPQTPQEHEVVRLRKSEIVKVTEELLTSISESDWDSYQKRCDPALSCFEPERIGNLVTGMSFHRFYFDHR